MIFLVGLSVKKHRDKFWRVTETFPDYISIFFFDFFEFCVSNINAVF